MLEVAYAGDPSIPPPVPREFLTHPHRRSPLPDNGFRLRPVNPHLQLRRIDYEKNRLYVLPNSSNSSNTVRKWATFMIPIYCTLIPSFLGLFE